MDLALALGRWLFLGLMALFLYQLYRQIGRELAAASPAERSRPAGPLKLVALAGQGMTAPGRSYPLDGELTLGRAPDNSITITDPFCSGTHARIGCDADGPWIEDLGSTNGTWLDGQRIGPQAVRLRPGMRLEFGATILRVER